MLLNQSEDLLWKINPNIKGTGYWAIANGLSAIGFWLLLYASSLAMGYRFFLSKTVAAARTAKSIVYSELASETGISAPTAKK